MPHLIGYLMSAAWLIVAMGSAQAQDERRIALLIGNAAYQGDISPLVNPPNDVALVKEALLKIGFAERNIILETNLGYRAINRSVNRYVRRLRGAGSDAIGFFYYSGHGAANAKTRTNYLIPTDVTKAENIDLWDNSVRLKDIIAKLREEASNATHFVIFDACRNTLRLKQPGKKTLYQAKGFKAERKVRGMLIAFATAEGETADDGANRGGPYARALTEEIVKPNVEAVSMFRNVQLQVTRSVGQEPWLTYGALEETYLGNRVAIASPAEPPPPANNVTGVEQAWHEMGLETTTDRGLVEAFIAQFRGREPLWVYRAEQRLALLPRPLSRGEVGENDLSQGVGSTVAPTVAVPIPMRRSASAVVAGVKLSSGNSLDSLRFAWALLNERHRDLVGNLIPRFLKQSTNSPNDTYNLIAGPFKTWNMARELCRELQAYYVSCETTVFTGAVL